MTLRRISDHTSWRGEPIGGKSYPRNIETLWTAQELAGIGLEVVPAPVPPTPQETAAIEAARRDSVAGLIDRATDWTGSFALVLLDEINLHAARTTAILDAVDGAATLAALKTAVAAIPDVPQRTIAQLKTALRNKLG